MRFLFYIIFAIILSSCSGIVNKLHRQIDSESGQPNYSQYDRFKQFKNESPEGISTKTNPRYRPSVKRNYKNTKKRYTVNDLNDNGDPGSIWGEDALNNLYSVSNKRGVGNIVIISVQNKLRQSIIRELKKYFPPQPKIPEEGGENKKDKEEKKQDQESNQEGDEEESSGKDDEKVYDKISTVIIEKINEKYVLIKGKKLLLFQGIRRLIQIKALIARRDIDENDTIKSNDILERSIRILK